MANAKNTLSAHTPGPWKIDTVGSHIWILSETSDYLATVITSDEEGRCRPQDATANAHLIAAAPDLLQACYAALELRCPDGDGHECGTFAVINDAIDKAEGK